MSDTVIKVENLSKLYRLGVVGTGTLSDDLKRWWHKVRGKEDPFSLVGETNVRETQGDSEYIWALKDINFEVKQGEVLGIIGKNGAGKSTLLKLLSKVTGPTTGRIMAKGRIASLLEVGTGFHPELTGRENIYLNGTILGMTRAEVTKKLEEIVEFAGVARYIDTPVKRYSSGMKVRLGFAVAAHLEPEILIVDEVLAVGDAEFQRKAVGKMQEVSGQGGRTVLFVSHNMNSVLTLCNRGLVLGDGTIEYIGSINNSVVRYLDKKKDDDQFSYEDGSVAIQSVCINPGVKDNVNLLVMNNDIIIRSKLNIKLPEIIVNLTFRVTDYLGSVLFVTGSKEAQDMIPKGEGRFVYSFIIPAYTLNEGRYYLDIQVSVSHDIHAKFKKAKGFDVHPPRREIGEWYYPTKGAFKLKLPWSFLRIP